MNGRSSGKKLKTAALLALTVLFLISAWYLIQRSLPRRKPPEVHTASEDVRVLFTAETDDIVSVTVDPGDGDEYTLFVSEEKLVLSDRPDRELKESVTRGIMNNVRLIRAEKTVIDTAEERTDLKLFGFDPYRCRAVILTADKKIHTLLIGSQIRGGIPYYLNYYDRRLSFAQNVQTIVFDESGPLFREHEMLFQALFTNSGNHMKVIDALAGHRIGLTRKVLEQKTGIDNGAPLTRTLQELEQCGFIRKYNNYAHKNRDSVFQLVDPFTLFFTTFRKDQKVNRWLQFIDTPSYYNWSGHAFEIVCLLHINQIKQALGIAGIQTKEFAWTANAYSKKKSALNNTGSPEVDDVVKRGAQIDLLIDRADKTITICEMKYTEKEYVVTKDYAESLIHKRDILREKTRSPKAMMIAMISATGFAKTGKTYPERG